MAQQERQIFKLGAWRSRTGADGGPLLALPAQHLVTHGVVVGMTGSGKTGLVTVLAEEALSAKIPTLIIDVKGDLPNLLLSFPNLDTQLYAPWLAQQSASATSDEDAAAVQAARTSAFATERSAALADWGLTASDVERFAAQTSIRVLTPGASSGEPLHVLSPLERRSARWDSDLESARAALSAAVSLLLRLLGREPDPAKSKEHVLLSLLAERRLLAGEDAPIAALMQDLMQPPIEQVGALPIGQFIKKSARAGLAAALNTLLASPTFASWRQGASLDVGDWLTPRNGRTPAVIVSVAHLDDDERALVLGMLLEEVLSWVRGLPGSESLRALVIFDEVYGYLPPYPANPPTKRPLVALMKQARAFGVGVVVATQNPMDLDYRALSNAGLWFIGRLQTDADRARVLDGLSSANTGEDLDAASLGHTLKRLAPRWFLVRNLHAPPQGSPILLQPRQSLSWLRGPMTRAELLSARRARATWEASNRDGESRSANAPTLTTATQSL